MTTHEFPGIEPTIISPDSVLHRAQKFLASAYDSVSGLFETTYPALRATREASRGRLTHAEQDLFRAAVVFAGAGLDAVFKEALRAGVQLRVENSALAREKFVDFAARHIQTSAGIDGRALASLLALGSPEIALKSAYIDQLTGSSLQSMQQVTSSLSALGLDGHKDLFKDAPSLNPLFKVRNQIAHELDLTTASIDRGVVVRHRNERSITAYKALCHTGLNYSQRVLNALGGEIGS